MLTDLLIIIISFLICCHIAVHDHRHLHVSHAAFRPSMTCQFTLRLLFAGRLADSFCKGSLGVVRQTGLLVDDLVFEGERS